MNFKNLSSLFFTLWALFIALVSCENKTEHKSEKDGNNTQINQLMRSGEKHYNKNKYDSAYFYYNKAKSLCDPKKDTIAIIHTLLNLATIEQKQGDYSNSETTILEAFSYLKTNPDTENLWSIYKILSINYQNTYDYKLAFYYNNLALNLKTDRFRKTIIKNNIASVYIDMNNYRKAIQILTPLITQKEVIRDLNFNALILDNLGYSYFKIGNPKALEYLTKSLILKEIKKNDWEITKSHIHLSEYYTAKNLTLATTYALTAYKKATSLKDSSNRLESLKLLILNSSPEQSQTYSRKYIQLNDSIIKEKRLAKNLFTKIKYDSKQDQEENLQLKTQKIQTAFELEQQKNRNLILMFLVFLVILSTIGIYYFLKSKNSKEKMQTSYDTETRISKKLHDELANDVYHTMAFAETQDLSTNHNKEVLLNNLDTIYSRTRNISKENSTINTGGKYIEELKEIISSFNNQNNRVLVNGPDTINWNELASNKKIIVYRVIQELLVNMKKHSQCSLAVISFKKNKNKLQIDYNDNGIGIQSDKIKLKNGLQNMENRIVSINGIITFDTTTDKGFKASFTVPL